MKVESFYLTKQKLQRAEKLQTHADARDNNRSKKIAWRVRDLKTAERFLCEEKGDDLREAIIIMKLNQRLNKYAKNLSNKKFLVKLNAGNVIVQELEYNHHCSGLVWINGHEFVHRVPHARVHQL